MLFYLVGAVLVYQASHTFAFTGLKDAPSEAIALIFLGLLTKGGIFVSGLWLPLTHAESETPVSALFSGVVVKAGVFPLVRCALLVEDISPLVRLFGVGTALLGMGYAVFEKDTKRMLAFHTVSQLGFVLAAPAVGGFYALTHGLVKATLFLTAGQLSSRNFNELKQNPMPTQLWIALVLACFSISGLPFLAGFGAKVLTLKNLLPWQEIAMNIAAVGTAISFAKFIFLPHKHQDDYEFQTNLWVAIVILLGGLFLTNGFYLEAYKLGNIPKALITIGAGWLAYWLIFQRITIKLPRFFEKFEQLIGVMSIVLTGLFWMVLA
jgi:multicomponent Na+:H+ antiporter subunit D